MFPEDGSVIYFSVNVSGLGVTNADRDLLDEVVSHIYDCGENLAHWKKADVSTTE